MKHKRSSHSYPLDLALALSLALCFLAAACGQFCRDCREAQGAVLRLHILANSNSAEDQQLKLRVRERLLEEGANWFSPSSNKEEAQAALQERLPQLAALAEEELRAAGCDATVAVELRHETFPRRCYGDYTLPAGDYDALRVLLGEGEGQNWWCVLYPNLCLPAAWEQQPDEAAEAPAALEPFYQPGGYEPRFALVELFQRFCR